MNFDFDFQRYVERRKGAREQQTREGAAYAYSGDLKVLRTLDKVKPVRMALEAAVRLWRSSARAELLGPALKVTEKQQPRVHAATQACAARLHVAPPTVYVTPAVLAGGCNTYTFGTDDDASILLHASLADGLSDGELLDAVGRECGHLQNDHVLYRTALYFLVHSASAFVRWIVSPAAIALAAWARRAELTGDRAGLLCSRDLEISTAALWKAALGPQAVAATPREELAKLHPQLGKRVGALGLFAESAYYLGVVGQSGGTSPEQCDDRVAELLK